MDRKRVAINWTPDSEFRKKLRAVLEHLEHMREERLRRNPLQQTATANWLHPYQAKVDWERCQDWTRQDWCDALKYAAIGIDIQEQSMNRIYRAERIHDEVILTPIDTYTIRMKGDPISGLHTIRKTD